MKIVKSWESMRQCAKSWEIGTYFKKTCLLLFLQCKYYFLVCSTNILVCSKKTIQSAVEILGYCFDFSCFSAFLQEFWCILAPSTKIFEGQYKSLLHFYRGGGVKAFLWTACYCQKHWLMSGNAWFVKLPSRYTVSSVSHLRCAV
jgi:hypothetical protein